MRQLLEDLLARRDLLPIKKVAVGALAGVLGVVARQLGADLGADELNMAAEGLLIVAAAYAVKDRRVLSRSAS